MGIPLLKKSSSLDAIWMEVVFTKARMKAEGLAEDMGGEFEEFEKRVNQVDAEQRFCWGEEIMVQAVLTARKVALQEAVVGFENDLLHYVKKAREAKEYKQFFREAPSAILHMGLETQLDLMRGWPLKLAAFEGDTFKAHGRVLEEVVGKMDEVIKQKADVVAKTAVHRVRQIEGLIDEINQARQLAYGELVKRGTAHRKTRDWARSFFRKD